MIENDPKDLETRAYELLRGARVSHAAVGLGCTIILDFESAPTERLSLRIDTVWRIERSGRPVIGSEDNRERLAEIVAAYSGRKIMKVVMQRPGLDLDIRFDDESRLRTFSVFAGGEGGENWIVFFSKNLGIVADGSCELREVRTDE